MPNNETDRARKTFDTLNSNTPTNADIDAAEEYLNSNPSFVAAMHSQESIDAAFSRQFIGNYAAFITVQEARDELGCLSTEAYYWGTGTQAADAVRKKATNNYFGGANTRLIDMVAAMDPEAVMQLGRFGSLWVRITPRMMR